MYAADALELYQQAYQLLLSEGRQGLKLPRAVKEGDKYPPVETAIILCNIAAVLLKLHRFREAHEFSAAATKVLLQYKSQLQPSPQVEGC